MVSFGQLPPVLIWSLLTFATEIVLFSTQISDCEKHRGVTGLILWDAEHLISMGVASPYTSGMGGRGNKNADYFYLASAEMHERF